jgi:hypothetical protein
MMVNCKQPATRLASITDKLSIKNPYTNHNDTPKNIKKYILKDTPSVLLYFHILINCGTKEPVVKNAAIKPIISI